MMCFIKDRTQKTYVEHHVSRPVSIKLYEHHCVHVLILPRIASDVGLVLNVGYLPQRAENFGATHISFIAIEACLALLPINTT